MFGTSSTLVEWHLVTMEITCVHSQQLRRVEVNNVLLWIFFVILSCLWEFCLIYALSKLQSDWRKSGHSPAGDRGKDWLAITILYF